MDKVYSEKVFGVLRSLFRYSVLNKMEGGLVLENEGKMLTRRIRNLTPEEIFIVVSSWEEFYKDQSVQDAIQDKQLTEDLDRYYQTLN